MTAAEASDSTESAATALEISMFAKVRVERLSRKVELKKKEDRVKECTRLG